MLDRSDTLSTSARPIVWQTGKRFRQLWRFDVKWMLFDSQHTISGLTTFKLEGEVTSLLESSQGEVGDNREVERLLGEVNCD